MRVTLINSLKVKLFSSLALVSSLFGGSTYLVPNLDSNYLIENNGNMVATNQKLSEVSVSDFLSKLKKYDDSATIKIYNSSDSEKGSGNLTKGDYLKVINGSKERKYYIFGFMPQFVSSGDYNTKSYLFLTEDGKLYAQGYNAFGQLGLGDKVDRSSPTLVSSAGEGNITQISISNGSSLILDRDGKLYGFGLNGDGQLGLSGDIILSPTEITNDDKVIQISTDSSSFLTKTGKLYLNGEYKYDFGENNITIFDVGIYNNQVYFLDKEFQVWDKDSYNDYFEPLTTDKTFISAIKSSSNALFSIDSAGKLYAQGYNSYGQLGLGHSNSVSEPTEVIKVGEDNITSVVGNGYVSTMVDKNGDIYTAGYGSYTGHLESEIYGVCDTEKCIKSPKKLDINISAMFVFIENTYPYTVNILAKDGAIYNLYGRERFNIQLIGDMNRSVDLSKVVKPNVWSMVSVPNGTSVDITKIPNNPSIWGYDSYSWSSQPSTLKAFQGYWIFSSDTTGYEKIVANREMKLKFNEFDVMKGISFYDYIAGITYYSDYLLTSWRLIGISDNQNGLEWSELYGSNGIYYDKYYPIIFYYDNNINKSWNTSDRVPYLGAVWVKYFSPTNEEISAPTPIATSPVY